MMSSGLMLLILLLLVLGFVIYWLLDRHEKRRAANGKNRHSGLRLFFASVGLLLLLFSGGCSLLFAFNADGIYVRWETISIIGGPFIVVGFIVWLVASRRRADAPPAA